MSKEKKRTLEESESMLERLRIDKTDLTQDEFASVCGIPRSTYMRWIAGKNDASPSPRQVKAICRILGITIEELPDEFGPVHIKNLDAN